MAARPVPMTTLGTTGLAVSRIGIGLAAVGRPGYITLGRASDLPAERTPAAMAARTAALLDAAVGAGVRYVDAARSYGRSEEFLAQWLTTCPTSMRPTVGSKWGYQYTANWHVDAAVHEEKELSVQRFAVQLAESRSILGAHLALYQIHSATMESECLDDTPLLTALAAARESGAVQAIGLTLSGPRSAETLARALDVRVGDRPLFDTVQATFNCLEPSLAAPLTAARDAGLGIIVKEVHANGRLSNGNDRPDDAGALTRLRHLRPGVDVATLAMAFVLAHPFVHVALSGAATVQQLATHVDALHLAIDAALIEELRSLAEPSARYWTTRARLPWS